MPKPQTAKEIAQAIERLEKSLPELAAAVQTAETQVSDAYASGESPDQALDALRRARDSHLGAMKALTDLDQRLYDAMTAERSAAEDKLREKMEANVSRFTDQIGKALAPLSALLGEDVVAQITASALKIGTEALEEARWAAPLPPAPRTPAPRNAQGRPMTIDEQNRGWTPSGRFRVGDAPARDYKPQPDPGAWLAGARQ